MTTTITDNTMASTIFTNDVFNTSTISNYTYPVVSGTTSVSTGVNTNTMPGSMEGSIYLGTDTPTINTDKHKINVDAFYEDVLAIKQILIELAKDEDLMNRNVVIRDILSEWMIRGLKK